MPSAISIHACDRSANASRRTPHIATGTRVVVMTADGAYVERAKD